jgi:general secretion pathway protein B
MSFILDALKKADRERNLNKVPTLATVHIPVYVTGRRVALWIVAVGLLGAAAVVWWLRTPTEAPVATIQPRPSVAVQPPTKPIDPERAPASETVASVPPAAVPESPSPGPSVPSRSDTRRQADRDRPLGPRPARPVPQPVFEPPPPAIEPEMREVRPVELRPPSLPSSRPEALPGVEASRPSSVTPPPPTAPPAQAALPGPAAPPTLREALSKMTLDVFVYTDVEADRMAVINGRRYVTGQLVDGLYLVESINRDGVTLSYRDERAVLRP